MTALSITAPEAGADTLSAALCYAAAGLHVLPAKRGTKNPGSVEGKGWPYKSSTDPKQIAAWFTGTDHDIALHCGGSGLVVLDVDNPDRVPEWLWEHLDAAPYQSSRPDSPRRGHYLFAMPPGRILGNSTGQLGDGWGEIRGTNGVIIAEPSHHANGGRYRWERTGPAPALPDKIAELLPDGSPSEGAATGDQVTAFLDEHTGNTRPEVLNAWRVIWGGKMTRHESRHDSMPSLAAGAMKEARAGYCPARDAAQLLGRLFIKDAVRPGVGSRQGAARTPAAAVREFADILAWAVGQAQAADLDATRARTEERMPARVAEVSAVVITPATDTEAAGQLDARPVMLDKLLSRSALRDLPDPEPLVENVLDQGGVALLYGKWGSGKSFIALDWAARVATGTPWQGRDTEQRRVLYVAAEGAYGLKGRTQAWETGWRTELSDGALDVYPRPVNLTHAIEAANLAALIDWNGYGLVVIDTLARCMVGADENSARDCGQVVDTLTRLREATPGGRGVVLGVHHTGKDGETFRGSSAFEAGSDAVYRVKLDGPVIALERMKRKDGPLVDQHRLRLSRVDGTPSVILECVSPGGETHDRSDSLLSHFASHFAGGGAYASQLVEVSAMSKATVYRALSDLLKRGDIVNTGSPRRPFYELVTK